MNLPPKFKYLLLGADVYGLLCLIMPNNDLKLFGAIILLASASIFLLTKKDGKLTFKIPAEMIKK